ncbi:MAG: hypothetical protein AUH41_11230 [Gemmatimonadetes bacterium 13_1_40CM_66_11]|nr:MAG: hypothetical protein AUH41_11230 [Gemmatimonadetes bacterium 13_1_40CM_66_11]
MFERRAAPPLDHGKRGTEAHGRRREPHEGNGDELQDRPTSRRLSQPPPGLAGERWSRFLAEALMVLIPDDQSGMLARGSEQRENDHGHVGIAPHPIREPSGIGRERNGSAPTIAQAQNHRPVVYGRHDRVHGERRQSVANPRGGNLAPDLDQILELAAVARVPLQRRQDVRGARQPEAAGGAHRNTVRAELRLDPPSQTFGDSAAPAARDHRAAAADEAHHLLELRVRQRDDGIQHRENRRPARPGYGKVVEFRTTSLGMAT